MRLSLCLIARNEEHNLPRAIASFHGLCDEIVLADTGSTDRTVEIARASGARVVSFAWCDDFSAARNFCISHAHGDWIFWLDADEQLLPESRGLVGTCIDRADVAGWFVLRQDLSDRDRLDRFTEMWQLRLFRRDPRVRFRGRCHPDFHPSLFALARERSMSVEPSAIRLRHWGFVNELRSAKLERAAKLLELELRDRPGQLYYEIEFGRTLLALGRRDEAQRVLGHAAARVLRHRNDAAPPTPLVAALLELMLLSPATFSSAPVAYEQVVELCGRWFPQSAPLIWAMSRCRFDRGDFEGAAKLLETLLELGRTDSYDRYVSFDPRIIREDAALNLAVCYIRLARLDDAETILRSLLTTPRREQAEQNLAAIARVRGEQSDASA